MVDVQRNMGYKALAVNVGTHFGASVLLGTAPAKLEDAPKCVPTLLQSASLHR